MNEKNAQTSADVVVVGSGLAGTTAALHAARQGCKVILLEKADELGGSTALSAGMFWTAPSLEAYQARIPLGQIELGRAVVNDYDECVQELRDMGVRVADEPMRDIMTFGIGYSTDIHAILEFSWNEIQRLGGEIRRSTPVLEVLVDDLGINGVIVRRADGSRERIASPNVVSATGGFQGDPGLRAAYLGPNSDRLVFRSNPGSVGDGLRMAYKAGSGGSEAMSTFYGHLLPYPMNSFAPADFLPASQYYSSETVLVNLRGERFADEKQGDEILNQIILQQPEARGVLIFDEYVHRTNASSEPFPGLGTNDRLQTAIDAGARYCRASTLEELFLQLGQWGIDEVKLQNTFAAYAAALGENRSAAGGVPVSSTARMPQEAPFHALMVQPSITFTFGGIPVTSDGEVLDSDGLAIPGYFAAGSDIGGLSNHGYAGGLAPAYITGRRAGRAVAERERQLSSAPFSTRSAR